MAIESNERERQHTMWKFVLLEVFLVLPLTLLVAWYLLGFTWGASLVLVPLLVILIHLLFFIIYFLTTKNKEKIKGMLAGILIVSGIWLGLFLWIRDWTFFRRMRGDTKTEDFMSMQDAMAKRSKAKVLWGGNNGGCLVTKEADTLRTELVWDVMALYWQASNDSIPYKDSARVVNYMIRKLPPLLNKNGKRQFYYALATKRMFVKYKYSTVYQWAVGTRENEIASVSSHVHSLTMFVGTDYLVAD
jgi:hypothetical protein